MGHLDRRLPPHAEKIKVTVPRIKFLGTGVDRGKQPLMSVGTVRVHETGLRALEQTILGLSRASSLERLGPGHQYQATVATHDQALQRQYTCRMSTDRHFRKFEALPGGDDLWREIRRMYPGLAVKYLVMGMGHAAARTRAQTRHLRAALTCMRGLQDILIQDAVLNGASTFWWHEVCASPPMHDTSLAWHHSTLRASARRPDTGGPGEQVTERLRGGSGPANVDGCEIWVTVVIKLSTGASAMQVAGCEVTQYPTQRGGFAAFRSSAMHRSMPAENTSVKAVFFLGPKR